LPGAITLVYYKNSEITNVKSYINLLQMSHDRRGSSSNPANGIHSKVSAVDSMGPESAPISALRICQDVQHMIDINSEHLERLRTPMTVTSGKNNPKFIFRR